MLNDASFRHPLLDNVISNILSPLLMFRNEFLEYSNKLCLDCTSAPELAATRPIFFSNPFQLIVFLEEESKPLVRNIDLKIRSVFLLQLFGLLSARKGIFLDLSLYIIGPIGKEDCRVGITARHFALGALQWWEEFRMNESRFAIQRMALWDQFMGNITSHAKVWVLVDGTRDQTSHIGIASSPKHERERRREGRSSLNSRKCNFANVGSSIESKDSIHFSKRERVVVTKYDNVHLRSWWQKEKKKKNSRDITRWHIPHLYLLSLLSRYEQR